MQLPFNTPLGVVMGAFCSAAHVDINNTAFLHAGRRLNETLTATDYNLQNGDKIDAVVL